LRLARHRHKLVGRLQMGPNLDLRGPGRSEVSRRWANSRPVPQLTRRREFSLEVPGALCVTSTTRYDETRAMTHASGM